MLKHYLLCFISVFLCIQANAQCPDLINNTSSADCSGGDCNLCGSGSITIDVNDINLPNGMIDWYSGTSSGFDPLSEGTLEGSTATNAASGPCVQCPMIEVIYIDACDNEDNEFMVISSGSGFAVDDMSITFDNANTGGSFVNESVNVGGTCVWEAGNTADFSGCSNLISAGPGDYIPPNSTVILQISDGTNIITDLSGLCGTSECIYVIRNFCDRSIGAFSNCSGGTGGGSTRSTTLDLGCGCSNTLTYDILDPNFQNICNTVGGDGTHFFADNTFANNGCNNGPNLISIPQFNGNSSPESFSYSAAPDDCNTTTYLVGVLNSDEVNEACCGEQITTEYTVDISCVEAGLEGDIDLCPGECDLITVTFVGGEQPYNLGLLMDLPFPIPDIPVNFPGFTVNQKIQICYDTGGPIVDPANFTINVPGVAGGFMASFTLNSVTDNTGCAGTITSPTVSIQFNDAPDANTPTPLEACDLGNGTASFDLAVVTNEVNGGNGLPVVFFLDDMGTTPAPDPYVTGNTTVYAQVDGDPCDSELVPLNLVVIENGDAGFVQFFCDAMGNTECTICDDDDVSGQEVNLTILFDDPTATYDWTVRWIADSGPSSLITGSDVGTATVTFTVFETTTFQIIEVIKAGECPDDTNLGQTITINYSILPDMDQPSNMEDCSSVTLPEISGNSIPSNAAYYDQPNGMGNMYSPGDVIMASNTLYLYGGIDDCEQNLPFSIEIIGETMIDEPDDVVTCGSYALPEITGVNVDNANYYDGLDGSGVLYNPGTIISTSLTLYLFNTECPSNQPDIEITITPGTIIENNRDTIVCDTFIIEPIIGEDLSGNENYFTQANGNGMVISVGDTITSDTTIYVFDDTGGCIINDSITIDIKGFAYPGRDTIITVCQGDPSIININEALGGPIPDSNGQWNDVEGTGIIFDSTLVDFSSLTAGSYEFIYEIIDTICSDTSSTLTVNIVDSPNAGNDASLTLCSTVENVNILALLNNPDQGGQFYLTNGSLYVFPDPTDVTFLGGTPGVTDFLYVVGDESTSCGADTSVFTLTINDQNNAGEDNAVGLCSGASVDLTTLLSTGVNSGMFIEDIASGGLTGSNFNASLVSDGVYIVNYIANEFNDCQPDTAVITITVADGASAGTDTTVALCVEDTYNLNDAVSGDLGGTFYENNVAIANSSIDYTGLYGTFNYEYIVGDGGACPFDTAQIEIQKGAEPDINLSINKDFLCSSDCVTVTIEGMSNGASNFEIFYSILGSNADESVRKALISSTSITLDFDLCIGIGDLNDNVLLTNSTYTVAIDSVAIYPFDCNYLKDIEVSFVTADELFSDISQTFCNDTTIIVGSDTYNMANPTGSTTLLGAGTGGCDSTINVNLSFEPAIPGMLEGTYCIDQTVTVGPDTYNVNNPSGTTDLPGLGQNGCDSLVIVNLMFQDTAIGTFTQSVCEGADIDINGTTYNTSNLPDDIFLEGGSSSGCDSLIIIDVSILGDEFGTYENSICMGDTLFYEGEAFFAGNETGQVTIMGATSSGCDSIIDVTITIEEPVYLFQTGDVCEDFSVTINNTVYDINNPSGVEIIEGAAPNGCDSIIDVNLQFTIEAIDSTFTFATCDPNYFLFIGNEVFNITNPTGTVILENPLATECDTTLNIDLRFGEINIDYIEVDASCEVVDSGFVTIVDINGLPPYNIMYNGNNTLAFTLPVDIPLPAGTGTLMIEDNGGCSADLPYDIAMGESGDFSIIQNGDQLEIIGGSPDSIFWSPSEGLSCTDCIDPIVTPDMTTTYTANIIYGDSCETVLMTTVEVDDFIPDYVFPNIISPNEDGQNDNFTLTITEGAEGIPLSMSIFDRWGNKVYENYNGSDIQTTGWDGTFNGNDVRPGVYVYQVSIQKSSGQIVNLYGDLTVIR